MLLEPPLSVVAVERPQPRRPRAFSGGLGGVSGGNPAWHSALGASAGGGDKVSKSKEVPGDPEARYSGLGCHLLWEREKPQTWFSCLPLRAHSCRANPRDAPQVQDAGCWSLQTHSQRAGNSSDRRPRTVPAVPVSGGTRRGEEERAPRDPRPWLLPFPRGAGRCELECGWLQTPVT